MTPNAEQIEKGLFYATPGERWQWITNMSFTATAEQCERGLAEKKFPNLAKEWIKRADLIYTQEQLEHGLSPNTEMGARIAWIERQDFHPTLKQVQSGLKDYMIAIQLSWIKKVPWTMVSNKMLQEGLKDSNKNKRLWWADKIPPGQSTLEQIERGLADTNSSIVLYWMRREDYTPTNEHINLGLKNQDAYVRAGWVKIIPEKQINPEQISNILQDSMIVQVALLNRNDFSLTDSQVAYGLSENNNKNTTQNPLIKILFDRFLTHHKKNQAATLKEIVGERADTKKPRV